MRTWRRMVVTTLVGMLASGASQVLATTYTWDQNGAGAGTGGTGPWDTTSSFWNSGANTWPTSGTDNDALFGGVAGTVTIQAGGVTANDVQFSTTGYTLTGGTLTLNGSVSSNTVDSGVTATISAPINAGNVQFMKYGTGTLTLSAGAALGNYQSRLAGGTIVVSGGTFGSTSTAAPIRIGSSDYVPGTGALRQTGGTVSFGLGGEVIIGFGGYYGYYGLESGTLQLQPRNYNQFSLRNAAVYISGGNVTSDAGAFTTSGFWDLGYNGATVVYATGGTASFTANTATGVTIDFESNSSVAQLTIAGSADWSNTGTTRWSSDNIRLGVINLNGNGRYTAAAFTNICTGTASLNFDGGTLRAGQSSTTFLQGLTSSQINAGGATIDAQAYDITIGQNLLAPTGKGLTSIPLATAGAGYIGAPLVGIGGGSGSGATAVAEWDPATGTVTGIKITNPGSGYTSAPTVSLNYGGYATAATLGTATIGTITGGGLTKLGSGVLTLSGTNTYTGASTVSNGTLLVTGATTNSAVTVVSNAVLGGTGFLGRVTVNAGGVLSANGTNTIGALSVTNLTLAENAVIYWNYDATGPLADLITVTGALTLPTNATVYVSGTGTVPSNGQMFSANSLSGASTLSGWTITGPGAKPTSHAVRSGNNVSLVTSSGMVITLQ